MCLAAGRKRLPPAIPVHPPLKPHLILHPYNWFILDQCEKELLPLWLTIRMRQNRIKIMDMEDDTSYSLEV